MERTDAKMTIASSSSLAPCRGHAPGAPYADGKTLPCPCRMDNAENRPTGVDLLTARLRFWEPRSKLGRSHADSRVSPMEDSQHKSKWICFAVSVSRRTWAPFVMAGYFAMVVMLRYSVALAADVPQLGLAECRARALGTAPELASAAADTDATKLSLRIANAAFLPSLRAEAGYLRSSVNSLGIPDFAANNGENEYIARAAVAQPLFMGGSLTAARAKAGAEASGAQHTLASVHAQILLATDRAYFGVLGAEEKRTIGASAVAVAEELLRATRVRLQNGEVPAFDVAKLELEVANTSTALQGAEADEAIARSELAILIGLSPGSFTLQPLASDAPDGLPPLEEQLARALADRPDVKRLEDDLRASEEAVRVARGARLPQVTAEAAGGYDSLDLPDHRNAGWQAGVAISLPLLDWNTLADRERIASLEAEKARRRLEAGLRAVRSEVTRRFLEAKQASERLTTSGVSARLAERNAGIARKGYEIGLVSSLELITAERQAIAGRAEHTAARYDYRVTLSELEFASGHLQ